MNNFAKILGRDDFIQDVAEYAIMVAIILALALGTLRIVANANTVFCSVGSSIR